MVKYNCLTPALVIELPQLTDQWETQVEFQRLSHQPSYEAEIRTIAESVKQHPALNNGFYKLWMSQRLSAHQIELFARNYYERVSKTPDRIALAFLNMTDTRARAETVQNLYDEMGNGSPAHAHPIILREFLEKLLTRLHGRPVRFAELQAPVLPSTRTLLSEGWKIFSRPDPAWVCGALLAQEWHAFTQLVNIYEGVRNYMDLFDLEEFHESCEYFYLHIGSAEKAHKIHAVSTAAQMCETSKDLDLLRGGFDAYLNLLAENWEEIYREIDGM
jgi:pyrroloquinoline quinone (PQQ) biosynthesis protein C